MGLSARLTAGMVALASLTAAAVGTLTYRNTAAVIIPRALDRVDTHARLLAAGLEASVRNMRVDPLALPWTVDGIVRSTLAGGTDPAFAGMTVRRWHDGLGVRLTAELSAKPAYYQARFIGIADGGREIVRVDRSGPDGAIRVVPDAELQQKGDRDYFQRTIRLHTGEIDVSPVELNEERGAIETPHVPVVRASTLVNTPDGQPFGIIVIDADLRHPFAQLRAAARPGGAIYVVNDRGDYLVYPDAAREFGFALGRPARVQDDFPALALALAGGETEPRLVPDRAGASFGVALVPLRLAEGPRLVVIETVPEAEILAAATTVRNSTLLAGLMAALGAAGLAFLLARSLTQSLTQMTAAVEGFGGGGPLALPTEATGEIGVLARAFRRMAVEVRDKTGALEQEIAERRQLFATSRDLIVITDHRGNVVDVSPSVETILGRCPVDMIGHGGAEFVHPDDLDRTRAEMRAVRRGVPRHNFECRFVHRDGRAVPLVWSGAWSEPAQRHFFIGRDMTERIALEQQLRQAQKLDAIGHLTGGVAHDFNNILTVISGTIEILADAVMQSPELAGIARMIDDAAGRGADLTRRLLAFARKQPLQPRSTDVNALVADTARLLQPTLGEEVEIQITLEPDAWSAMIDPSQLSTALINLAVNARDAMPGGGKLTLETANVILDESYASINAEVSPGPYVMIAVSDTGTGIPVAIRDHVFEPFFTTKETGRGTGLGLSMVYGFVKQSGGHIKVYSEEGHGTTFKLYLPQTDDNAGAGIVYPMMTATGGTETILAVEDDALVRQYVVVRLQSLGYSVLAAASAREALDLVSAGVEFDLLFTDVIIGADMNGRQLADAIAGMRPNVKVLYTSGYTENAIIHHGRLDPGVALIDKPYRMAELARKIREVLGTPGDQATARAIL
jgi:PAS domain S-box-containing protein